MPNYEYACRECQQEFIVSLSLKEYESKPEVKCPHCKCANVQKKFSATHIREKFVRSISQKP